MTPVLSLSTILLKEPSVTPNDFECQNILADFLGALGFECEFMFFGDPNDQGSNAQIKNLYAKKKAQTLPLHTYVLQDIPMLCL